MKVEIITVIVVCCFYLGFTLFIFLSPDNTIDVNANGDPSGLFNNFQAFIQGKKFWTNQLRVLDKEISDLQRMAEIPQEVDRALNEAYQKYPELRPSPTERTAEALRARADEIENAEFDAYLEKNRIERIRELRLLRPKIESKCK